MLLQLVRQICCHSAEKSSSLWEFVFVARQNLCSASDFIRYSDFIRNSGGVIFKGGVAKGPLKGWCNI